MIKSDWRKRRAASLVIPLTVVSLLAAVPLSVQASAQGGTAKPPAGAVAPFVTPTLPDPVTSVRAGCFSSRIWGLSRWSQTRFVSLGHSPFWEAGKTHSHRHHRERATHARSGKRKGAEVSSAPCPVRFPPVSYG